MTTTHTNLALVEGEAYILAKPSERLPKQIIHIEGKGYSTVLASTANLEGIPQLDRKHFMKPKVDVEELANKKGFLAYPKLICEEKGCETKVGGDANTSYRLDFIRGFLEGHNAKESEFTREEFAEGLTIYKNSGSFGLTIDDIISKIRPLSLPKSVTLNDNNEVISVEW